MITISKVKKLIGKEVGTMSDEQIQKELDMAAFLSEIILDSFKKTQLFVKVKSDK